MEEDVVRKLVNDNNIDGLMILFEDLESRIDCLNAEVDNLESEIFYLNEELTSHHRG